MTATEARPSPPDQAQRDRIFEDLGSTLFVEAGAGSGKTTALVGRVVALVRSGVELASIAAITFTEKAGAELRDRLRQDLQTKAQSSEVTDDERARLQRALGQLDSAAIGTLHSFAQRILSEHPVEAGLPPRVEVLDEVSSGVKFDRRWDRTLEELLTDPALERTILLLHAADVEPRKLRALALKFDQQWDLVEERIPQEAPEPPRIRTLLHQVQAEARALAPLRDICADPSDSLLECVDAVLFFVDQLGQLDDDIDLLEHIRAVPRAPGRNKGRKPSWDGRKEEVLTQTGAVCEAVEAVRTRVLTACLEHLGSVLRRHTLDAARARQREGRLEFHDLLVLARKVLRDPASGAAVRQSLHDRYQRLLLDEFQDTDPIQIELAVRIAAADPATADHDAWHEVPVEPGRLFVVGDPKQSIYRFRRADIAMFLQAKDRFSPEAGGPVELTANFRTGAAIIGWVNHVFDRLMGLPADVEVPNSQPSYMALEAQRPTAPGGPAVAVIGRDPLPEKTGADVMRAVEATSVANVVTTAIRERWPVKDGEGWRPCRLEDITILVPARTSLPFLEDALTAAGVPYRAESSSIVYATRAVRDVMMVMRAIDDPTDHHRIVAALRTPLLGCGDDDLYRFKVLDGGSWSYTHPALDTSDGPVGAALGFLRDMHSARTWLSPAELLDRVVQDLRVLELGFAEGRPRDVWRRLRFVIDQARAWSDATGGSLRAYLHWVEQQTSEGLRVSETILPETDDDAVRIMTIHGAKGLEFPITILSGMSTAGGGRRATADVVFPQDGSPPGYCLGKDVRTDEYQAYVPIDEQMGYDERIRLLYVACTRASDHLVVSLVRKERKRPDSYRLLTSSELLIEGMGAELTAELPDLSGDFDPLPTAAVTASASPPPPFDEWAASTAAALMAASVRGAVAATALTDDGDPDPGAPEPTLPDLADAEADSPPAVEEPEPIEAGLQKRPRDLDLPPWLKGRYGSAIGRAVHGVLQTVDLATGAGMDGAVAAQCMAEAIPDQADQVRRLVEQALDSPCVRAAAAAQHWREIYCATPVGERVLEGYVDLLYRSGDGLVVVDHKTSASADPEELDRRVASYRLQGAAYALTLARSTGEAVTRVVFLFLTPAGAIERELPDLAAAVAEVEHLISAGRNLVESR